MGRSASVSFTILARSESGVPDRHIYQLATAPDSLTTTAHFLMSSTNSFLN